MADPHDDPSANGNAAPFDLSNPDIHEVAGFVVSLSVDVKETKAEVQRIGRIADKVALALGIQPDKSDPPPNFREKLDSQQEEIKALRKVDTEVTGSLKAVSADAAEAKLKAAAAEEAAGETKLIVRANLPKLVKVGLALTGAIGALTVLVQQIWSALRGH